MRVAKVLIRCAILLGLLVFAAFPLACVQKEVVEPPEAIPFVEKAKQDLAVRKGVSVGQIKLVRVEAVDWPDTSLGCPEPGKSYAEVITPGFRIILRHIRDTYEYHSDRVDTVFLCPQ